MTSTGWTSATRWWPQTQSVKTSWQGDKYALYSVQTSIPKIALWRARDNAVLYPFRWAALLLGAKKLEKRAL